MKWRNGSEVMRGSRRAHLKSPFDSDLPVGPYPRAASVPTERPQMISAAADRGESTLRKRMQRSRPEIELRGSRVDQQDWP